MLESTGPHESMPVDTIYMHAAQPIRHKYLHLEALPRLLLDFTSELTLASPSDR